MLSNSPKAEQGKKKQSTDIKRDEINKRKIINGNIFNRYKSHLNNDNW